MKNSSRVILVIVCIVLAVFLLASFLGLGLDSAKELSYTEFMDRIESGEIQAVYIENYKTTGYAKKGGPATFYVQSKTRDDMADAIEKANPSVDITFNDPNAGAMWVNMLPFIGIVVVAIIFIILMRKMQGTGGSANNFGKMKTRIHENVTVRFSDVAGAEEEKAELAEVVEFLRSQKKFTDVGARIPRGVLLVGPPGTGKTLFAKAVAGEAKVPFFSISGSEFVEMFVGVGASRVRDLFETARKNMPCIIFIDEIDAVGRQRGTGLGGGNDEREQTLNQLLVQMDGFNTNDGIIIMAATNRADILDPALLRPGRFDRQIYVNVPDVRGREAIFKVHARNKPMAPDVDFKTLARMTSGFTGADIANLLNEAAILAARDGRKQVTMLDINEGINKVIIGPQKKSRLVTDSDKRITAYHEAGHAIVARALPGCDPVHEVSIIPRGMAAGYTMTRPESDDAHMMKSKLLDDIAMTMGGRAAEEIVIKDISTGASGDIRHATAMARKMVNEWGMSESVGPLFWGGEGEVFLGRDYQAHNSYSETVAAQLDAEVRRIVDDGHKRALETLNGLRPVMDNMARLLIERETIYSDEIDLLMEGKTAQEVLAFIAEKEHKKPAEKPTVESVIIPEKKEEAPVIIESAPNAPEEKGEDVPTEEKTEE